MSVRYFHPVDEDQVVGQPQKTFFAEDQNAEWWVGLQRCAVGVALAAVLAISATQTTQAQSLANAHQDDPAGNLTATVDEYFWSNPTPPVPLTLGALYLPDPEEIPAGSLTATVDEYFWQNPVAPVPLTFGWLYLPDSEELPAGSLFSLATAEEFFWQNPTAPVPASLQWPQQWTFDEQSPALFPQPDEDFWQNPTPPVAGSLIWPQPQSFDEQFPAGFLTALDEEGVWTPQVPAQLWPTSLQVFQSDDFVSTPTSLQPDEDFWTDPQFVASLLPHWEISVFIDEGSAINVPLSGDEDFWFNPAPLPGWVQPQALQPLQSDEVIVAQPASAPPNEDYWLQFFFLQMPVVSAGGSLYLPDPEGTMPFAGSLNTLMLMGVGT